MEDLLTTRQLLSPPGDTLQETLTELGMSQAELAERMGRPLKTINEIIKGKAAIMPETAMQLERVLQIPAHFWMRREQDFREKLARLEEQEFLHSCINWLKDLPLSSMRKYGWISDTKDKPELVHQCLSFFGVATPKEWYNIWLHEKMAVSFRISLAFANNPGAIAAWLRHGEIAANEMTCAIYDGKKLKALLPEFRALAEKQAENFQEQLVELAKSCGLKIVFTPPIPKASISGATRWVGKHPLIQLSGRYKTNDTFWFTFFHELAHVLLHGKRDIFLEDLEGAEIDDEKEQDADRFASNLLLDKDVFETFVLEGNFEEEAVLAFAKKVCMHPAIVLGRLQHRKLVPYRAMRHLKVSIELF